MSENLSTQELKNFLKSLPKLSDKDSQTRVNKAKKDFRYFVQTYLGQNAECKKHKETSIFRNFVYESLPTLAHNKQIIKAYRGAAKTTLISRLFALWQILRGDKRYCLIISSTLDLAKEGIDLLKTELEDNANLALDFGILPFNVWSSEEISFLVAKIPVKTKSFGAGKKIRGTNFLLIRPDLIICDDIENDENIENKSQRDKLYKWFNKAILKLPARLNPHYQILLVGTTLHYDSLLLRCKKRQDFITHSFPLVIKFPSNIEELSKENLNDFVPKNFELDDAKADIKDILSDYLQDSASFYSEFQNLPFDKENAPLSTYSTFVSLPSEIDSIIIGIDPSMGKARGDYFALSTLYYYKKEGKIYCDGSGYKITPDKIIALFIKLQKMQKPLSIACEEIAFQEFFKNTLKSRFQNLGLFVPIIGVLNTAHKSVRLLALSPLLSEGSLIINENVMLLKEELDTYPKCPHNDLLDSIDIALQVINRGVKSANYKAIHRVSKDYKDAFLKAKEF